MLTHYRRAFEHCQPYVLTTQQVAPLLEWEPLGLDIRGQGFVLDPQARSNEKFVCLLRNLDQMSFGTLGMAMPQWVFYDCGVMPSAIFGFAGPAGSLEPWVRRALQVTDDDDQPVPLSSFIAIPMPEKGSWFTHTLCSLTQVCAGAAPEGLASLSLGLGLRMLKVETLYGTIQWRSDRMSRFTRLGPLEVITAYTPAHSMKRTLTWRLPIRRNQVEAALSSPGVSPASPPATHMLDVDDVDALLAMQEELEAGIGYSIVGPPIRRGSIVQVPLCRQVNP